MSTLTPPAPADVARASTASSTAGSTAGARPARDPLLDNAKFLLVALVVIGHSWTLVPATGLRPWVYDFLYAWHVPAFVLVTGYLSRSFTWSPRRLRALVTTVAVPYVVFEALLALLRTQVGGEHLERLWLNPHWPMWYLAALLMWRLATPVFTWLWAPVAVLSAVALSLTGGIFTPSDTLDISRTLGLLPFFVVGLTLRREHLAWLQRAAVQRVAVGCLTLIALVAVAGALSPEWLYYRTPYDELGASSVLGMATRAGLLVVGLLGGASFLSLVPSRTTWFSRLGAASLVVYLFHGFAVLGVAMTGFPAWAGDHVGAALLVTSLGAFALAALLGQPRVAARLTHVVDPVGSLDRMDAKAPAPDRLDTVRRHSPVPRSGIGH